MLIYSKELLYISKKQSPVEIIGALPNTSMNNFNFMKRGNEIFAIASSSPTNNSQAVQTADFIYKTTDFKNWQGSGIGSMITRYDEQADSFFAVTLGGDTTNNLFSYHITKINPDNFSYKTTTILSNMAYGSHSRGISPIQRVGTYLMLYYYRDHTNTYVCYSSDNGETWKSSKLCSISGLGVGGSTETLVGNGTKAIAYGYVTSSSSYSTKCFSSPTSSVNSSTTCRTGDRPTHTSNNNIFTATVTNNVPYLKLTSNLTSDTTSIVAPTGLIKTSSNCYFYDHYVFITYYGSYSASSTIPDYFGKIVVYDFNSQQWYLFDLGLQLYYSTGSGKYVYNYATIRRIMGIIDGNVYVQWHTSSGDKGQIVRVHADYILESMQLYTAS